MNTPILHIHLVTLGDQIPHPEAQLRLVIFTTFIHFKEKGEKKEEKKTQPRGHSQRNKQPLPRTRPSLEAFPEESSHVKPICPGSHRRPGRLRRGEEFKHERSVFLALSSVTPQHAWLALQNCLLQRNTCQKLLTLRFLTEKDWLLRTTETAGGGMSGCTRQSAYSGALFYPEIEKQGRAEVAFFLCFTCLT